MTASSKASTESADSALRANNPFERAPVVRAQNIWGETFPDVPSLNAIASNSVFEVLKRVQVADSSLDKVTSMVFTADKGVGKSHVISRIRKRLQLDSKTIFIYAGADRYGNLDYINALFQQSIAESLEQTNTKGVSQWQEIATLLVTEALVSEKISAPAASIEDLASRFDQLYYDKQAEGKDLVSVLAQSIRKLKSGIDPYVLRAVIWTLSEERGSFAVKWLAGEQLGVKDAADLGLPVQDKSESEKDASAINRVSKILLLVNEYKSIVICFDELDTLAANSDGHTTEMVILDLVKRLFDSVRQSHNGKGIILLTVLIPDVWRFINSTTSYSKEKITSYGKPIDLDYLKADTIKELVAENLRAFYGKRGIVPPTPLYPFVEEELSAYAEDRPSPRQALTWLATLLNKKIKETSLPLSSLSYRDKLEQAYQNAIAQFEDDVLDENDAIASAIKFCFKKIIEIDRIRDQPIEGVIIKSVEEITPKRENGGWLNCKIVGEESGRPIVIGIGVLQQTNGLSVGAGFRRLLDTKTFSLSRGCLIRSKERKLKRNWDSYEYYQQLVSEGGEWVDLIAEDIKPLLALQYIYNHHEKFDLSIKRLNSFAFTRSLLQQSPLIQEILSRPSGSVDEDAAEGQKAQHWHEDVNVNDLENELKKNLVNESVSDETEMQSDLQGFAEALSV